MPECEYIPGTSFPRLDCLPLQAAQAEMVSEWIAEPRARCWLDLGGGVQQMSTRALYLMLSSPRCHTRLFRVPGSTSYFGLVCLSDCTNLMCSADVWGIRGGYGPMPADAALSAFLSILANGFLDLKREVIGSWIVEGNELSIAMHERLGLRNTGRQRARHRMNGRLYDRLLYDITREEFASRYPHVMSESGRSFSTLAALNDAETS